MTQPDPTPTAPDIVDHRREALAAYLLDEVEIYCSTRDSALRRAYEILAACDAHGAAEIERLRAEVALLQATVDETSHQAAIMDDTIATLRARVAELERSLQEIARMAAKLPRNGVGHDIYNCAVVTLAIRGNVPTPDPRDARIAELERSLREARAVDARTTNPLGVIHGICDRALGEETSGG